MDHQKIEQEIKNLADLKYKEFHGNLCPGTDNILGVRVPVLRDYAKKLAKENFKEYLDHPLQEYYEEVMLEGMLIGLGKLSLEETFYYLKRFIPKIDNWAVCDVCAAGMRITKKYPREMYDFLQPYLHSEKEFELRFGLVMLLDFYITEEYIDSVLEICNYTKHEGYYVKMAVAWLISIAYIKFPEKTMKLLKKNDLDDFTYNKALQKIIESYRVEKQDKDRIRNMKRK